MPPPDAPRRITRIADAAEQFLVGEMTRWKYPPAVKTLFRRKPDGTVGPEPSRRLLELGKWLSANGATIYGTRRGPIAPQAWGVSTAKGSKDRPSEVFLHVLDPDAESPIVLGDAAVSLSPFLFGKEVPLRLIKAPGGLALDLPRDIRSSVDTIVALRPQALK